MYIMCDDKIIGRPFKDEKGDNMFKLIDGIPEWLIPEDLFKRGATEVSFEDMIEWCCDRVFPSNRIGKEILLKELGVKGYDPWSIAKETRASLMTDFYWVAMQKGDKYETHSARGRAGYKPIDFD